MANEAGHLRDRTGTFGIESSAWRRRFFKCSQCMLTMATSEHMHMTL